MILDILTKLAATTEINKKMAILADNKDNDLLREVFRITYTKQLMFHIKKFPTEVDMYHGLPHSLSWAINEIMENLATRKVTGSAARESLRKTASLINEEDREVLRRIINRDLECGAGTTLPNRVWPKLIPEQPQCLATPFSLKAMSRIKYPAISQLKADGARCMSDLISGKEPRKVTRANNEYTGLTNLDASLVRIADYLGDDYVMDGELVYRGDVSVKVAKSSIPAPGEVRKSLNTDLSWLIGDDEDVERAAGVEDPITPEEAAISDAKREAGNGIVNKSLQGTISDKEQQNIVYQVWDLVPYDIYYGDKKQQKEQDPKKAGYQHRLARLVAALQYLGIDNIEVVPTRTVNNFEEAKADYNQYRLDGMEGSILKNVDFVWRDSRVPDQVKIKNKTPIDLKIIDVYPHKKDPNKVGGFVVVDASGHAQTNTGSGLTDTDKEKVWDDTLQADVWVPLPCTLDVRGDLDREYIMANKDRYIGAIIEMEVDGLQRSKTRKKGDPEFSFFLPIIKKMRWDKNEPNDIYDIFADVLKK